MNPNNMFCSGYAANLCFVLWTVNMLLHCKTFEKPFWTKQKQHAKFSEQFCYQVVILMLYYAVNFVFITWFFPFFLLGFLFVKLQFLAENLLQICTQKMAKITKRALMHSAKKELPMGFEPTTSWSWGIRSTNWATQQIC